MRRFLTSSFFTLALFILTILPALADGVGDSPVMPD
jgi:hypothetical protein